MMMDDFAMHDFVATSLGRLAIKTTTGSKGDVWRDERVEDTVRDFVPSLLHKLRTRPRPVDLEEGRFDPSSQPMSESSRAVVDRVKVDTLYANMENLLLDEDTDDDDGDGAAIGVPKEPAQLTPESGDLAIFVSLCRGKLGPLGVRRYGASSRYCGATGTSSGRREHAQHGDVSGDSVTDSVTESGSDESVSVESVRSTLDSNLEDLPPLDPKLELQALLGHGILREGCASDDKAVVTFTPSCDRPPGTSTPGSSREIGAGAMGYVAEVAARLEANMGLNF